MNSLTLDELLCADDETRAAYTLDQWADTIGEWAAETFDHTAESIMFHIQEKAVKLGLSTAGIRGTHPLADAAGLLVLTLTYIQHARTIGGFGDLAPVSDWLTDEMQKNHAATFASDETGLMHRVD